VERWGASTWEPLRSATRIRERKRQGRTAAVESLGCGHSRNRCSSCPPTKGHRRAPGASRDDPHGPKDRPVPAPPSRGRAAALRARAGGCCPLAEHRPVLVRHHPQRLCFPIAWGRGKLHGRYERTRDLRGLRHPLSRDGDRLHADQRASRLAPHPQVRARWASGRRVAVPGLLARVQGPGGRDAAGFDSAIQGEGSSCVASEGAAFWEHAACQRNASRCTSGIGRARAHARDGNGSTATFAFGTSSRKPKAIGVRRGVNTPARPYIRAAPAGSLEPLAGGRDVDAPWPRSARLPL